MLVDFPFRKEQVILAQICIKNNQTDQIVQQSGGTLSPVSSLLQIEFDEVEDDNRHRQGMS